MVSLRMRYISNILNRMIDNDEWTKFEYAHLNCQMCRRKRFLIEAYSLPLFILGIAFLYLTFVWIFSLVVGMTLLVISVYLSIHRTPCQKEFERFLIDVKKRRAES